MAQADEPFAEIGAAIKKAWGTRVTTVLPKQGHYANDPAAATTYPPADITIESIAGLLQLDLATLLSAASRAPR